MRAGVVVLCIGALFSSGCRSTREEPCRSIAVRPSEPLTFPTGEPGPRSTRTSTVCDLSAFVRQERRIPSDTPGIELFTMEIPSRRTPPKGAVVLLHGAGSPASAIWDLQVGDYSMMRKLACAGYDSYAVDLRGFGGSTMPPAMSETASKNPPLVRGLETMPDVSAAVREAASRSAVDRVDLVGWSWGADVAASFAGLEPGRIRRLVLVSPVYDRRWASRHVESGAWREEKRSRFFELFDPRVEERAVLEAHVEALFRFAGGDVLRLPNGPYRDLYGTDAPFWDAAKIEAPTLIVRGEKDAASLDVHAQRLFGALSAAAHRRYVVLGGEGHFPFRTRAHGALAATLVSFLDESL